MISADLDRCKYAHTKTMLSEFLVDVATAKSETDSEFYAICSHWHNELSEYLVILDDMKALRKMCGLEEPYDEKLVTMVIYSLSFVISQDI